MVASVCMKDMLVMLVVVETLKLISWRIMNSNVWAWDQYWTDELITALRLQSNWHLKNLWENLHFWATLAASKDGAVVYTL